MTLIDVWAALNEGYMPTNHQLAQFVMQDSKVFSFDRLTPSGRAFGKHILELRQLLADLVRERNKGEDIQRLVWELRLAAAREVLEREGQTPTVTEVLTPKQKKKSKKEDAAKSQPHSAPSKSSETLRHLRTVTRILLVQPQIRYILSDAVTLFAQIVATTAEETLPIAQGQMEQVPSEAAVLKESSSEGSATVGAISTTESNQLGANGFPRITPDLVDTVIQNPDLKLKVPLTASTVVDAAQMAAVAKSKLHVVDKSAMADFGKKVTKNFASNAENVWDTDGKRRAIDRLRKLCVDLQRAKGYKEAAQFFFSEATTAVQRGANGIRKAQQQTDRFEAKSFDAVLDLLENFGGEGSARDILKQTQTILSKTHDDEAALQFFTSLDTFVKRALFEELYATTREAESDAKALHNKFMTLNKDLREDLLQLLAQLVDFAVKLAQDEYLNAFIKKIHELFEMFAKTSEGKWGFNMDLWRDASLVVLPTLVTRLGVLPIPRIMYTHPDFDFVVENVALELHNLIPKYLDREAKRTGLLTFCFRRVSRSQTPLLSSMTNDVHIDFETVGSSEHNHMLKIKIRGMSLRVHRFAFALTMKKAFKFHDHGIADLTVGGFGLSIILEIPKKRKNHYFVVRKCKAKLEKLQFHIRKSNHRILHALASSITNSFPTRKILSLIIGRGVVLGLKQLDLALMEAHLQREEDRRLGIVRKTEISLDELRSRAAAVRDLMRKYNESAGTFQIDFTASEDPKNEKKWEDAHAVRWVKETLERTGAQEEKVHEWRNTAFGDDDPVLLQKGVERPDGYAARNVAKAERGMKLGVDAGSRASTSTSKATQEASSIAATTKAPITAADSSSDGQQTNGPVVFKGQLDRPDAEREAISEAEEDLSAISRQAAETRTSHGGPTMESEEGKRAVRKNSDVSDQIKDLEQSVERRTAE
ncbi:hypothetical protein A4X09_0g1991 [Tilletia walkeri]|uniref:HAM1-like N-terminal domain-containing protein n=1 Tax=Tilletia walkeri TaxID=117179 RepID=A0A8X7ND87_9BASI|nr:hypothetical protein A4X09_0g1991 [Tilletia walkeri]